MKEDLLLDFEASQGPAIEPQDLQELLQWAEELPDALLQGHWGEF